MLSTMKAKFVMVSVAVQEFVWLKSYLSYLGDKDASNLLFMNDDKIQVLL